MLSIIVAMDDNRLIGKDNGLPWRLPADLQYFKQVTMGHTVVMGRKTFESIGRALPGRRNLVLTRNEAYQAQGCTVIHSLDEIDSAPEEEVFVIGGAEIFREMLPRVDRLYLTRIHAAFEGDAYFPEVDESKWRLISTESGVVDEENPYPYEYLVFEQDRT